MKRALSVLTVMIFVATLALLGVRVPAAKAAPVPGPATIYGNVVNVSDEDIEMEDELEELEDLEASSGNFRLAGDEDIEVEDEIEELEDLEASSGNFRLASDEVFGDDFDDFGFPFGFDFD